MSIFSNRIPRHTAVLCLEVIVGSYLSGWDHQIGGLLQYHHEPDLPADIELEIFKIPRFTISPLYSCVVTSLAQERMAWEHDF